LIARTKEQFQVSTQTEQKSLNEEILAILKVDKAVRKSTYPETEKAILEIQTIAHKVETQFLKNPFSLDSRHLKGITKWVYAPFFRHYETKPIQVDEAVTSKTKNQFYNFIHLPGHTLGSMGIQLKNSGIILTGDALFTGKKGHIDYSPPVFSLDPVLERKSIPKLMDYEFEILASGHGLPIDNARIRLNKFLHPNIKTDS